MIAIKCRRATKSKNTFPGVWKEIDLGYWVPIKEYDVLDETDDMVKIKTFFGFKWVNKDANGVKYVIKEEG